ncbi:MAG: hypothetical protein AMJ92_11100 [candidate division Zixibacteria bacterium SM23_81]|nr:MAG: hypothetical protein AMJ92_11100 [candidate division Zixibacteria bacterium SM23_81]
MDFVTGLALVLLTLVGYSSGTVLGGRGRRVVPGLLDLAVVAILWVGALGTRPSLGKMLAILVWIAVGITVGAALTALRRRRYPQVSQKESVKAKNARGLRRWWQVWKAFAAEMGNFQGRALLAFFYFIIVTPFGVPVRFFSDPLRLRKAKGSSFWLEQQPASATLEKAREQF